MFNNSGPSNADPNESGRAILSPARFKNVLVADRLAFGRVLSTAADTVVEEEGLAGGPGEEGAAVVAVVPAEADKGDPVVENNVEAGLSRRSPFSLRSVDKRFPNMDSGRSLSPPPCAFFALRGRTAGRGWLSGVGAAIEPGSAVATASDPEAPVADDDPEAGDDNAAAVVGEADFGCCLLVEVCPPPAGR